MSCGVLYLLSEPKIPPLLASMHRASIPVLVDIRSKSSWAGRMRPSMLRRLCEKGGRELVTLPGADPYDIHETLEVRGLERVALWSDDEDRLHAAGEAFAGIGWSVFDPLGGLAALPDKAEPEDAKDPRIATNTLNGLINNVQVWASELHAKDGKREVSIYFGDDYMESESDIAMDIIEAISVLDSLKEKLKAHNEELP